MCVMQVFILPAHLPCVIGEVVARMSHICFASFLECVGCSCVRWLVCASCTLHAPGCIQKALSSPSHIPGGMYAAPFTCRRMLCSVAMVRTIQDVTRGVKPISVCRTLNLAAATPKTFSTILLALLHL